MSELSDKLQQIKTQKDTYIIPGNIKSGVTVLGVTGSTSVVDTADGDATATDILVNKSAYANGQKVTGSMANNGRAIIFPDNTTTDKSSGYYSAVKVPSDTNTELYRTCSKLAELIRFGQTDVPSEYTQLEYLEGTGTQYIKLANFPQLDTNISNGTYDVLLDAQFTEFDTRGSGSMYHLEGIGAMSTSAMDFYKAELYVGWKEGNTPQIYYSCSDNNDTSANLVADTKRHLFKLDSTSSTLTTGPKGLYLDDVKVANTGPQSEKCKYKYRYCLFGYENASGVWCNKIKIFRCTIKQNSSGNVLYDLIPAKRNSDGVVGMFDKTHGQFLTNNGTGTFLYGEF